MEARRDWTALWSELLCEVLDGALGVADSVLDGSPVSRAWGLATAGGSAGPAPQRMRAAGAGSSLTAHTRGAGLVLSTHTRMLTSLHNQHFPPQHPGPP